MYLQEAYKVINEMNFKPLVQLGNRASVGIRNALTSKRTLGLAKLGRQNAAKWRGVANSGVQSIEHAGEKIYPSIEKAKSMAITRASSAVGKIGQKIKGATAVGATTLGIGAKVANDNANKNADKSVIKTG